MQSLSYMAELSGDGLGDADGLFAVMSRVTAEQTTKGPVLGTDRKTLPPYSKGYDPLQDEAFVDTCDGPH